MKDEMNHQHDGPDPLLGAALRWADGEVPLDEVDWSAMRTNIRNRAGLPLARLRATQKRSSSRWVRPLIPIGAAASIAVILWTGGIGRDGASGPAAPQAATGTAYQISIQEALLADMSEQEFRRVVADRNDPNELLLIAVSQR